MIAFTIENDLVSGAFDYTVNRYRELLAQSSNPHPLRVVLVARQQEKLPGM
jgi:hypothetical protein